jgi:hypothetical protein
MHNLNYTPTPLGIQSWREITSGDIWTKQVEYRWSTSNYKTADVNILRQDSKFELTTIFAQYYVDVEILRHHTHQSVSFTNWVSKISKGILEDYHIIVGRYEGPRMKTKKTVCLEVWQLITIIVLFGQVYVITAICNIPQFRPIRETWI